MAIPEGETEEIFHHVVMKGLLGGTTTPSSLRRGFSRIKEAMEVRGASDEDLSDLKRRIEKAIDDYPWWQQQRDQQDAARDSLFVSV